MAAPGLIHCTACGREVSKDAAACPGCGHPIRQAALRTFRLTNIIKLLVFVALLGWITFAVVKMIRGETITLPIER